MTKHQWGSTKKAFIYVSRLALETTATEINKLIITRFLETTATKLDTKQAFRILVSFQGDGQSIKL